MFTEGVGTIALMRLDDALAGRHPIYAVIRGSAVNNDGGGKSSYMAPSIAGQERVIREALKAARVEPEAVSYVEAHGTATVLGDAIELAALTRVFRGQTDKVGFCQLGSVKSNIGHTVSAAGVAGLIKTALALKQECLPPNVNFQTPNPDLDVETSPFFVSAQARPWPRAKGAPRIAGVSSFGVGGTNAHAILEEAPARPRALAKRSHYVLTLSAASDAALSTAAERLHARLKGASRRDLADVAYTLNVGRRALNHRAAIVCANVREARDALAGRAQSTAFSGRIPPGSRTVAFMFPGQGSQYVGMGRQLYAQEPEFRATIDRCLGALRTDHGLDLSAVFSGADAGDTPDEAFITRTEIAQPLIFMVEYALGQLLVDWGVKPAYAIGHQRWRIRRRGPGRSLRAARRPDPRGPQGPADAGHGGRGHAVHRRPPRGDRSPDARRPGPGRGQRPPAMRGQLGCAERIDAFAEDLMRDQIHSARLRTSHAFHSRMMEPMLEGFRRVVERVRSHAPTFPLVSNETGAIAPWEMLRDPDYWVRHVRAPVRFSDGVQTLAGSGVDLLLEVGPGRQLSGLAQQCGLHRQGVRIINTLHNDGVAAAEESMLMRALSRIWLEGGEIDWRAVHRHERRQMAHLPPYPFERERFATPAQNLGPTKLKGRRPGNEWFYVPTWKRAALPLATTEVGVGGCWLTFEDDALGGAAARRASRAGPDGRLGAPGSQLLTGRPRLRAQPDVRGRLPGPLRRAEERQPDAAPRPARLDPRSHRRAKPRGGGGGQAEHLGLQVLAQIHQGLRGGLRPRHDRHRHRGERRARSDRHGAAQPGRRPGGRLREGGARRKGGAVLPSDRPRPGAA